jgi:N-acetyl-anhydromuramyl-L-alanine amidase AmpD
VNRAVAAFFFAQAVFAGAILVLPGEDRLAAASGSSGGDWEPSVALRGGWTHIIVHHSASATGSAAHFDRVHREEKGWDGLGYHFVIGNGSMTENGRVEAGFRWKDQLDGAHAKKDWNARAVGICLVGDFEKGLPTPEQAASLERICAWLCRRCGIPPANVLGHNETEGNRTLCPGRGLDLTTLRSRLGGAR